MEKHLTPNYNQITDNIWIGNNMCCMVHATELLKLGFDADIDMEDTRPEEPPHTKIYLWLPTKDHTPPSMSQLAVGVAGLVEMVNNNQKVYVHCRNGHGRAPTLVAAYLTKQGLNVTEALTLIKSKRPSVHLEDAQFEALINFHGS